MFNNGEMSNKNNHIIECKDMASNRPGLDCPTTQGRLTGGGRTKWSVLAFGRVNNAPGQSFTMSLHLKYRSPRAGCTNNEHHHQEPIGKYFAHVTLCSSKQATTKLANGTWDAPSNPVAKFPVPCCSLAGSCVYTLPFPRARIRAKAPKVAETAPDILHKAIAFLRPYDTHGGQCTRKIALWR